MLPALESALAAISVATVVGHYLLWSRLFQTGLDMQCYAIFVVLGLLMYLFHKLTSDPLEQVMVDVVTDGQVTATPPKERRFITKGYAEERLYEAGSHEELTPSPEEKLDDAHVAEETVVLADPIVDSSRAPHDPQAFAMFNTRFFDLSPAGSQQGSPRVSPRGIPPASPRELPGIQTAVREAPASPLAPLVLAPPAASPPVIRDGHLVPSTLRCQHAETLYKSFPDRTELLLDSLQDSCPEQARSYPLHRQGLATDGAVESHRSLRKRGTEAI